MRAEVKETTSRSVRESEQMAKQLTTPRPAKPGVADLSFLVSKDRDVDSFCLGLNSRTSEIDLLPVLFEYPHKPNGWLFFNDQMMQRLKVTRLPLDALLR